MCVLSSKQIIVIWFLMKRTFLYAPHRTLTVLFLFSSISYCILGETDQLCYPFYHLLVFFSEEGSLFYLFKRTCFVLIHRIRSWFLQKHVNCFISVEKGFKWVELISECGINCYVRFIWISLWKRDYTQEHKLRICFWRFLLLISFVLWK